MEMCLDEKWKLPSSSKKGGGAGDQRCEPEGPQGPHIIEGARRLVCRAVPGRLASPVKEQRARFYIVRRCVTMLVCWRD
ncbi:unnamed protein product [Miscanthus lutarioriparius]|uniref:Uncharacterized protein n=1 Tax=Miscanthus lutarioriparius TaxID=422564 RepID=A0A811RBU0_9POAL|nr:unnamed protein product [Miscanthus lutarioriparius]